MHQIVIQRGNIRITNRLFVSGIVLPLILCNSCTNPQMNKSIKSATTADIEPESINNL